MNTENSEVLSPEEFKSAMLELKNIYKDDKEEVHIAMDGLMCGVLTSLGYGEGVDIFDDTPMWYA